MARRATELTPVPTRSVRACALLVLCSSFWLSPVRSSAQTNEETFQQVQWAFDTPGARAKGMGKAFIAVANDATATVTNPAGFNTLSVPQMYFEYTSTRAQTNRIVDFSTRATSGRIQRTNAPSFVGLAVPVRDDVVIGFTRHEFLNYTDVFELGPRLVPLSPPLESIRLFPVVGDVAFHAVNYGGTIAAALNPRLSVGVTVSLSTLDAYSSLIRYDAMGLTARGDVPATMTRIDDTDIGTAVSLGALYRVRSTVAAGVTYSKGPFFTLERRHSVNPGFPHTSGPLIEEEPLDIFLNVPERLGGGIAARVTPWMLFAMDAIIVRYSDLTKDVVPVLGGSDANFTIEDRTELHFGGELTLRSVRLRAGWYTDPDHSLRFRGSTGNLDLDPAFRIVYNSHSRDTKFVGTFGLGTIIKAVQLDGALTTARDIIVSGAVRFR